MSEENEVTISDEELQPDNIIKLIQKRRMNILMSAADIDKSEILLMNSITKTAIDTKRINVDDSNSAADRDIAASLVKAVGSLNDNPFLKSNLDNNIESNFRAVALPDIEVIHEETSRDLAVLEYNPEDHNN